MYKSKAEKVFTRFSVWFVPTKMNAHYSLLSLMPRNYCTQRRCKLSFSSGIFANSSAVANSLRSSEERVYEVVLKQAALVRKQRRESALDLKKPIESDWNRLNEAYERCREVCAEYDNTFYLGIYTCSFSSSVCMVDLALVVIYFVSNTLFVFTEKYILGNDFCVFQCLEWWKAQINQKKKKRFQ